MCVEGGKKILARILDTLGAEAPQPDGSPFGWTWRSGHRVEWPTYLVLFSQQPKEKENKNKKERDGRWGGGGSGSHHHTRAQWCKASPLYIHLVRIGPFSYILFARHQMNKWRSTHQIFPFHFAFYIVNSRAQLSFDWFSTVFTCSNYEITFVTATPAGLLWTRRGVVSLTLVFFFPRLLLVFTSLKETGKK